MAVYKELASRFHAWQSCKESGNEEWQENHSNSIEEMVYTHLPSGSGIDSGNSFDYDHSKKDRLVINSAFHAMDPQGFYNGWINYQVIIKPSLAFGLNLQILGRFGKRQDIKEYLHLVYYDSLTNQI